MKIICDQCSAKYSVDTSKLNNKNFRITCKRCGNKILVENKEDDFESFPDNGSEDLNDTNWDDTTDAPDEMEFDEQATRVFNYQQMEQEAMGGGDMSGGSEWYIHVNGQQKGPLSLSEVQSLIQSEGLDGQTNVWKTGMADWTIVENVPELASFIQQKTTENINPFGQFGGAGSDDAFGKQSLLSDEDADSLFQGASSSDQSSSSSSSGFDSPFGDSEEMSSSFGSSANDSIDLKSLISNENIEEEDDIDASSKSKVIDFRDIAGNNAKRVVVQHASFNTNENQGGGKKGLIIVLLVAAIVAAVAAVVIFMMMNKESAYKVVIASQPTGANVFVNNELKGVTPAALDLEKGSYNIKIERQGYEQFNSVIAVSGDLTKSFNLNELLFAVKITSTPEATVEINGENKGVSPITLKLKKGEYNLKLLKDGYDVIEGKLTVEANDSKNFTLQKAEEKDDGGTEVATNSNKGKKVVKRGKTRKGKRKVNKKKNTKKVAVKKNTKKVDDLDDLLGSGTKKKVVKKNLPAKLTKKQVLSVIKRAYPKIKNCGKKAGVTGTVKVKFRINGSGSVSNIVVPTSAAGAKNCIYSKVRGMRFPQFSGSSFPVNFPFKM